MSKDIKTSKDLFHEALEALSLHVGDKTTSVAGYRLKHLNNALVVSDYDGWVSIRSGISLIEFHKIMSAAGLCIVEDLLAMVYTLADYMNANSMNMVYRVHGDTEDSFVWTLDKQVYIGSRPENARAIAELSPMDFYELMNQAGVCLVEYSDGPTDRVGEYAIVSKIDFLIID